MPNTLIGPGRAGQGWRLGGRLCATGGQASRGGGGDASGSEKQNISATQVANRRLTNSRLSLSITHFIPPECLSSQFEFRQKAYRKLSVKSRRSPFYPKTRPTRVHMVDLEGSSLLDVVERLVQVEILRD
jgi:hypothetical protein